MLHNLLHKLLHDREKVIKKRLSFFVNIAQMAPTKKSSSSPKIRSSSSSISLKKVKGENFYRNAKQVARLKVLNGGKPIRDKDGKIIQAAAFQKGEEDAKPGRVQPDRRWFGELSPISAFHARYEHITRQYQGHLANGSGPLQNKSLYQEKRPLFCLTTTEQVTHDTVRRCCQHTPSQGLHLRLL
jgi:hypothetical protein